MTPTNTCPNKIPFYVSRYNVSEPTPGGRYYMNNTCTGRQYVCNRNPYSFRTVDEFQNRCTPVANIEAGIKFLKICGEALPFGGAAVGFAVAASNASNPCTKASLYLLSICAAGTGASLVGLTLAGVI